MKIAFLRTNMFGKQSADAMAPLIFAIIKALTPDDITIIFCDENVEKIPDILDAEVIAMTVDTFNAKRAFQLAEACRQRGQKVIMGGFHPTMLPEECLNCADTVVIGDAEDTWPRIIEDLKNQTLQRKYYSKNDSDLSAIVYDNSVYQGKRYNDIAMVQFSRGCRFSCDFCSVHAFYKDTIRCKNPETIVSEIQKRKEKLIFFIDDNLFAEEKKVRELCEALIPLKKKWFCQISIDAAKNIELLKLMKQSGCLAVLIGFESLSKDNLKLMKKTANLQNVDYSQIITNIYSCHLMIYATFVVGYDFDSGNSIRDLLKFTLKNRFFIANFNPLMPMPGTKLYQRLKEDNKLVSECWWLDETYKYGDALLIPKQMTEEELKQGCREARYNFYSWKNILCRFWHKQANAYSWMNGRLFLAANWISRKEIHSKQGRRLGADKTKEIGQKPGEKYIGMQEHCITPCTSQSARNGQGPLYGKREERI
jgi:radical SAM superfamily enzyme YgiQ (UPF0313 family)